MIRFVVVRLAWMIPALLGVTLLTFALMDAAPYDRAEAALARSGAEHQDLASRERALAILRERFDLVDAETGERRPFLSRYQRWLAGAVVMDFAGPGGDPRLLRERILVALPVTLLLNVLAIGLALAVAIPLGARLGLRAGGRIDRTVSGLLLAVGALPRFVLATLLIVVLAGVVGPAWFPAARLQGDPPAEGFWQFVDLSYHLVLPTIALAVGPAVVLTRFLRDGVARAVESDFVVQLRGLGMPEAMVRRAVVRNGIASVVTILGGLLAGLVAGSVVVESVFALPGLGGLLLEAFAQQDLPTLLVLTLLGAVTAMVGFLIADILHGALDPRVQP